jgi:hypothetical protein
MPTLTQIIKNQAEFVANSGYTVDVDIRMDTVAITHESNDDELNVFLQDHNGADFIRKAHNVWEECSDITEEESWLAEAKQHIESL